MEGFHSELFPSISIYIGLFSNVSNSAELKQKLKTLNCCFLNSKLIVNIDHVLLAVSRALYSQANSKSKTNNLYLDIVYYLSASSNIRQALQKFGIQENSESIVLISLNIDSYQFAVSIVKGNLIALNLISQYSDTSFIMNEFKISQNEASFINGLASAVFSRIAIKDL